MEYKVINKMLPKSIIEEGRSLEYGHRTIMEVKRRDKLVTCCFATLTVITHPGGPFQTLCVCRVNMTKCALLQNAAPVRQQKRHG